MPAVQTCVIFLQSFQTTSLHNHPAAPLHQQQEQQQRRSRRQNRIATKANFAEPIRVIRARARGVCISIHPLWAQRSRNCGRASLPRQGHTRESASSIPRTRESSLSLFLFLYTWVSAGRGLTYGYLFSWRNVSSARGRGRRWVFEAADSLEERWKRGWGFYMF